VRQKLTIITFDKPVAFLSLCDVSVST